MSVSGDYGGTSAAKSIGAPHDQGPPAKDETAKDGDVLQFHTGRAKQEDQGVEGATMEWSPAAEDAHKRKIRRVEVDATSMTEDAARDDRCETVNAKHVEAIAVRIRNNSRPVEARVGLLLALGTAALGLGGAFSASMLADHVWLPFFQAATPWVLGVGLVLLVGAIVMHVRRSK